MNNNEFEKDLNIDLENLEAEAIVQPELYFKYCSLAREAREAYDMSKLHLNVVEAKLSRKIREKPRMFGVTKVIENAIKEAILIHPKYESAYRDMVRAKSEADILGKAENAMEMRKRMLELLVQLYSREYFSGPKIAHTPEVFWDQIKKKKGEKLHEEMTKRSRRRKKRG